MRKILSQFQGRLQKKDRQAFDAALKDGDATRPQLGSRPQGLGWQSGPRSTQPTSGGNRVLGETRRPHTAAGGVAKLELEIDRCLNEIHGLFESAWNTSYRRGQRYVAENMSILIADDEELDREILQHTLTGGLQRDCREFWRRSARMRAPR